MNDSETMLNSGCLYLLTPPPMTKYIPLEEVKKYTIKIDELLKNISDLTDEKTFKPEAIWWLFSKEWGSVKWTINVNLWTIWRYLCRIEDIPTIDPIATIDEMIEENEEQSEYPDSQYNAWYRHWLQELKSRLSTNS